MFYEPGKGHGLPHDPIKSIVAPRPIGWIATLDAEGRALRSACRDGTDQPAAHRHGGSSRQR